MSNNIYTPYTYLIGWSNHNKYYYGRRTAKNCHPGELWKSYFTSSKYVKRFRIEHGDPDIIEIRQTFDTAIGARKWEEKVLTRLNVKNKSIFLNESNGINNFDTTNKKIAINLVGENIGLVSLDDPRWKSGEIIGFRKGKPQSEESKYKRSKSLKGRKLPAFSATHRKKISEARKKEAKHHKFIHKKYGVFFGPIHELVEKYPKQTLCKIELFKVPSTSEKYKHTKSHKGWTIKKQQE